MDPFNALRATYYLVLFGIDIAQVPSSVRHSLELVRTCYADVQHLIELRQTYLSLLEKRPPVLERVNTIIAAATNGLVEVCAIVEKCRPEANKGRVPFRQRVEWIFFDEKELRAQEPVISRHHATVLAELNFLRQIALFAPAGAGDDKTSQKPHEKKVFDNVALLGDLIGGASDAHLANISTETPSMSTNPYPMATMPSAEPFIHPPPAYTAQPASSSNSAAMFPSFSEQSAAPTKPMQSTAPSTKQGSVVFSSHDAAGLSLMFGGDNNISAAPSRAQLDMHRAHSDMPTTGPGPSGSLRPQPPRSATDQPYSQHSMHHNWGVPPPSSHGMPHPQAPDTGRPLHPGQFESQNNLNRPNMWQNFDGSNEYTQRHAMPAARTPSPRPSTQHIEAAAPPNPKPQKKGWADWEHDLQKIQGVAPSNTRERDLQSHLDTCVNAGVSPLLKPQEPDWSHPSHMPGHLQPMPSTQTLRSDLISPATSVASPAPMPSFTMPDHAGSRPQNMLPPGHTSWNNPPGVNPGNVQLLSTIPPGMIYGQSSLNMTMPPPMQQTVPRHDTSASVSTISSNSSVPPHTFQPQHMPGDGIQHGHCAVPGGPSGPIPTAPGVPTMWELPGSSTEHLSKVDHTAHSHYHAPVVEKVHELSGVQFAPDPVELPAATYRYDY